MPSKTAGEKEVDAYLASVPEPARTTLNKLRDIIRSAVPEGATEAISYGVPAFKYGKPLAGYAAYAGHCSYFPMSGSLLDAFPEVSKKYATSKGAIRFPIDKPLPATLVKKLVKARLAEVERSKPR
ncbi:MAG: DUF1801 domain-containing protein [Bryobacterales bacterium]|nr:DUF1801 domain-containing protein [Bryobacterales bacterium]